MREETFEGWTREQLQIYWRAHSARVSGRKPELLARQAATSIVAVHAAEWQLLDKQVGKPSSCWI